MWNNLDNGVKIVGFARLMEIQKQQLDRATQSKTWSEGRAPVSCQEIGIKGAKKRPGSPSKASLDTAKQRMWRTVAPTMVIPICRFD